MMRLFFTLCLILSFACRADTFVAAGDPWPPFLDPDDKEQGVSVAIVRAALKTQGHELEFRFMPWARAMDGVKNANMDVLVSAWRTKEREAFLAFSEPYLENAIKFITRKDDDFEFHGLQSLAGKAVGIVRGYGYGDEFLSATHFKRPEVKEITLNIKKLIAGRIDLTLDDELVAKSAISKKNPKLLQKIRFTNNALSRNSVHVASGLANAKHQQILDAFNKGLNSIKGNGEFDAILKQYKLK